MIFFRASRIGTFEKYYAKRNYQKPSAIAQEQQKKNNNWTKLICGTPAERPRIDFVHVVFPFASLLQQLRRQRVWREKYENHKTREKFRVIFHDFVLVTSFFPLFRHEHNTVRDWNERPVAFIACHIGCVWENEWCEKSQRKELRNGIKWVFKFYSNFFSSNMRKMHIRWSSTCWPWRVARRWTQQKSSNK